jgi:hypothetical protein
MSTVYRIYINSIQNLCQQYSESISTVYRIYINSIHNIYQQYIEYISTAYIIYIHLIQHFYILYTVYSCPACSREIYWYIPMMFATISTIRIVSNMFCRGFMFYLCYFYLFKNNGIQHDFHIRWCSCRLAVTRWMPHVE